MKCSAAKKQISLWLKDALEPAQKAELQTHWTGCAACSREAESSRKLEFLLRAEQASIQPSAAFEANFWRKASEPQSASWVNRIFEMLDFMLPSPSFSQALAAVLIGLLLGGAGGILSAVGTAIPAHREILFPGAHDLTGFSEFKGLPSSSLAAAYLQTVEKKGAS